MGQGKRRKQRESAEREDDGQWAPAVFPALDAQAQGEIDNEADESYHGINQAVIGGGKPELILNIIIERIVIGGGCKAGGKHHKQEYADPGREQPAGFQECRKGVCRPFQGQRLLLIGGAVPEQQADSGGHRAEDGNLSEKGAMNGEIADDAAHQVSGRSACRSDGGADRHIASQLAGWRDVCNVGHKVYRGACGKQAGQHSCQQDGRHRTGQQEGKLPHRIAQRGEDQYPHSAHTVAHTAPERTEQELCDRHSRKGSAEQVSGHGKILEKGRGDGMHHVGSHKLEEHQNQNNGDGGSSFHCRFVPPFWNVESKIS